MAWALAQVSIDGCIFRLLNGRAAYALSLAAGRASTSNFPARRGISNGRARARPLDLTRPRAPVREGCPAGKRGVQTWRVAEQIFFRLDILAAEEGCPAGGNWQGMRAIMQPRRAGVKAAGMVDAYDKSYMDVISHKSYLSVSDISEFR
jgi:hypothetical protein